MALAVLSWVVALPLLGFVTGLRSLTALAVLAWFAHTGNLPLDNPWDSWIGKLPFAIGLTVLAVAEGIADKLPSTPNRTSAGPLIFRLLIGGFVGAIVADGLNGSGIEGAFLGVLGSIAGAFFGYYARKEIVTRNRITDWKVALLEDALAIGCAIVAAGIITG
jgi:uncharacterized membrane protein